MTATVARASGRLGRSSAHTVVAIAGATGSGKSTTFNALAGTELSAAGAQRPTTSVATALVWSDEEGTRRSPSCSTGSACRPRAGSGAPPSTAPRPAPRCPTA
ncbi:GTPase [Nocardioides humi]|uniref:GTPase n=1 Tax=Nocardioides humi TaxID=449461 RepID=UPI0015E85BAC|nr:GTPase [Nocardioides humi]